ncbi:uncharacterized protein K460DRAFT_371723 [Cucurbitaria berberidis CBS 394.84]|uniref:Uncharacterized protein n=1 Tax=Cucurbitaria berberidis CBS 394.84 TaxID=1168544 RepID=A0A9P4L350_9PLEO|nr:uncharacterized protein K460DRAFT_371723 [Cucurbitaria berberidis CBS 394.84]KAF1840531.1 hypothetical protein K460DRAFT_371723 [Cucurbitaria berberidis CBS 394.84]
MPGYITLIMTSGPSSIPILPDEGVRTPNAAVIQTTMTAPVAPTTASAPITATTTSAHGIQVVTG